MRKLQLEDTFKFARLLKVSQIKDKVAPLLYQVNEMKEKSEKLDKDDEEYQKKLEQIQSKVNGIGIDLIMTILESCADEKVENAFYKLWAGVTEKSETDLKAQSLELTIEQFLNLAKENNLTSFFNAASRL